jgi:hypothetical protein
MDDLSLDDLDHVTGGGRSGHGDSGAGGGKGTGGGDGLGWLRHLAGGIANAVEDAVNAIRNW